MGECVVRVAKESDMQNVMAMIQELADFENMPDGPKITAEILRKDCFENIPPLFKCAVAEYTSENREEIVGYAIYFNIYSTWEGKSMMLEDIYVKPEFRKKGFGKMLFKFVTKNALETFCCRVDFHVLNWNPAIYFYNKFGAIDLTKSEKWHYYRLDKNIMEKLVKE